MRTWWSRPGGVASWRCLGAFALVACTAFVACGGDSKSNGEPSTGGAGRGGNGAAGSGARGGTGGTSAAGAGAGTAKGGGAGSLTSGGSAGTSGSGEGGAGLHAPNGGIGGSESGAGGAAGDDASVGGESSVAGSGGNGCRDLCTTQAPACCTEELRCVEDTSSCRIEVLADQVDVIYEYAELEAEIRALSGGVDVTLPLSAVERAAIEAEPSARLELALDDEASDEYAALAELHLRPFRVSCGAQELFVGVVYILEGAAAIRTPVLHIEASESGALVLRLGAFQGAWPFNGSGGDEALRERIDRTELRAELCERGILSTLP